MTIRFSVVLVFIHCLFVLSCKDDPTFVAAEQDQNTIAINTADTEDNQGEVAGDDIQNIEGAVVDPSIPTSGTVVDEAAPTDHKGEVTLPTEPKNQTGTIEVRVIDEAALRDQITVIVDCPTRIKVGLTYECDLGLKGDVVDDVIFATTGTIDGLRIDPSTGKLVWTPTADQIGTQNLDVVTMMGSINTTTSLTFDVVENSLPIITASDCPESVMVGSIWHCPLLVTDLDDDPLTYSLNFQPDSMDIDPTGTIDWLTGIDDVGYVLFEVEIGDGVGSIRQYLSVQVYEENNPPVIRFVDCPPMVDEDSTYTCHYEIIAEGLDDFEIFLEDGPRTMAIDQINQLIEWKVPNVQELNRITYTLFLGAGDEFYSGSNGFFALPANDPPQLRFTDCPEVVHEDETFACSFEAIDSDGDTLYLTLDEAPDDMFIGGNDDILRWQVPNTLTETTRLIVLTVSDAQSVVRAEHLVTVIPVNDPPRIEVSSCRAIVSEDEIYRCSFRIVDVDDSDDAITVELDDAPTGMAIEGRTVVWVVPNTLVESQEGFTLVADDGEDRASESIGLTVLPVNDPPTVVFDCLDEVREDHIYSCTFTIDDIDDSIVGVRLIDGPAKLGFDGVERRLTYYVPETLVKHEEIFRLGLTDKEGETIVEHGFTVIPTNDPPQFAFVDCPDRIFEDEVYRCGYTVSDIDDSVVDISLVGDNPTGMTVDTSALRIVWTVPNELTTHEVVYTVQVGDAESLTKYTQVVVVVAVNDPPKLSYQCIPSMNAVDEDALFRCIYQVEDIDDANVEVFLVGAPAGMTLDSTRSVFEWTPGNTLTATDHSFEIVAQDGKSESRLRHNLTVSPVNDPPTIELLNCAFEVDEDELYECSYRIADIDGDSLTVTLTDGPAGMILDQATKTVRWTAPNTITTEQVGFDLVVADNTLESSLHQNLTVNPVNDLPQLSFLNCPAVLFEDEVYSCTYQLTDIDGDQIAVSLIGAPSDMNIVDIENRVAWQAPAQVLEQETVTYQIRITDQKALVTYQRAVTLIPVATAPAIVFDDCQTGVFEHGLYTCHYRILDSDTYIDAISVSLLNNPDGMTIDTSTALVSWTVPELGEAISYTQSWQLRADDGVNAVTVSQSVIVAPFDDSPVITFDNCPITIAEDQLYRCTYTVLDPEGATLVLSLEGSPAGMAIDEANRMITWTVPETRMSYPLQYALVASDGHNVTKASMSLTALPINDLPVFNFNDCATTVDEDQTFVCGYTLTDQDNALVTVVLVDPPAGMLLNTAEKKILWTVPNIPIQQVIQIVVRYNDGSDPLYASHSLTVNPINDPPELGFVNCSSSIDEDATYRCGYTVNDIDDPIDQLVVTLQNAPTGMSIDQTNKLVTWIVPNQIEPSTVSFQLMVSDQEANTTRLKSVLVQPVNDAPQINLNNCVATIAEDLTYRCVYQIFDIDGDALQVTLSKKPVGMTIDTQLKQVVWTTPNVPNQPPTTLFNYELRVSDGTAEASLPVQITVTAVNDPPELTFDYCPTMVDEGTSYICSFSLTDIDGDQLTASLSGQPTGMTLDASGTSVLFTSPRLTQDRTYNYSIIISDGFVEVLVGRTVTVRHINHPPLIAPLANLEINELDPIEFFVSATDQDGDALIYTAFGLPNGAVFDSVTHSFRWVPKEGQAGNYPAITFSVSDGEVTVSRTVAITVARNGYLIAEQDMTIAAHHSLKTDILFVLETSGSKNWINQGVADTVNLLLGQLEQQNEYQVALLLGHDGGKNAGRLFSNGANPKIMTRASFSNGTIDFKSNLTSTHKASPDDGDAGIYSLNKAIEDLADARSRGTAAEELPDLNNFFRSDAGLSIVFIAEENDVCYRTDEDIHPPYGDDTDPHHLELPAYLRDCFPLGLTDAQKTADMRMLNAEFVLANAAALKPGMPITVSGIIFRDMDNPADYPLLNIDIEAQTGRGYSNFIKYNLGDEAMNNDDPRYLGHIIDLLAIRTGQVEIGDGMRQLGSNIKETEVEITLDHLPTSEIRVELIAVDGSTLDQAILLSYSVIEPGLISVTIPVTYYFSMIDLSVVYEYRVE